MVIRIMNVPEGLQPGQFEVKFIRMCGDIAIYEYIGPDTKIFEPPSNPTTQGTTNGE